MQRSETKASNQAFKPLTFDATRFTIEQSSAPWVALDSNTAARIGDSRVDPHLEIISLSENKSDKTKPRKLPLQKRPDFICPLSGERFILVYSHSLVVMDLISFKSNELGFPKGWGLSIVPPSIEATPDGKRIFIKLTNFEIKFNNNDEENCLVVFDLVNFTRKIVAKDEIAGPASSQFHVFDNGRQLIRRKLKKDDGLHHTIQSFNIDAKSSNLSEAKSSLEISFLDLLIPVSNRPFLIVLQKNEKSIYSYLDLYDMADKPLLVHSFELKKLISKGYYTLVVEAYGYGADGSFGIVLRTDHHRYEYTLDFDKLTLKLKAKTDLSSVCVLQTPSYIIPSVGQKALVEFHSTSTKSRLSYALLTEFRDFHTTLGKEMSAPLASEETKVIKANRRRAVEKFFMFAGDDKLPMTECIEKAKKTLPFDQRGERLLKLFEKAGKIEDAAEAQPFIITPSSKVKS